MNLIASMIVRNELGRYLPIVIPHLLAFCDEIRVRDDGSDDGTLEWLEAQDRVHVSADPAPKFFEHEGRARNALLEWTLKGDPTHVLAIDADEIVTDGQKIRAACETDIGGGSWSLHMEEVWNADARTMWTREDGGWRQHGVGILWRVPHNLGSMRSPRWRITDRKLACGREPQAMRRYTSVPTGSSVLHLGWLNQEQRAERHARYVEHDKGRFHNRKHLDSIMWTDGQVRLRARNWPDGIDRAAILEAAGLLEPVA